MVTLETYHLLPEWAKQSACFIAWPQEKGPFAPWLADVEKTYVAISLEISQREKLIIACRNAAHQNHIRRLLDAAHVNDTQIEWHLVPYEDTWTRDYGPLSVMDERSKKIQLLDFKFNGWGQKYTFTADDSVTQLVFKKNKPMAIDFILEGGSIDTNGEGILLTTERCLLSRHPELNKQQLTEILKKTLGVHTVWWLKHGYLSGDDTDAHVDTLARFCNANTICYQACEDPNDFHYAELKAMEKELLALKNIHCIPLPFSAPILNEKGARLPASYANFLIVNDAVLVPTYDNIQDDIALERLQSAFPHRKIVGIPCQSLTHQFGSLHCAVMQLPEGI